MCTALKTTITVLLLLAEFSSAEQRLSQILIMQTFKNCRNVFLQPIGLLLFFCGIKSKQKKSIIRNLTVTVVHGKI